MQVEVVAVVGVDAQSQVGSILVGCAAGDGVGTRERSVGVVVGRCAGENANLEGASGLMFFHGFSSKGFGDYLRRT